MTHIALLGDSIFDNKSYSGSEPDVVSHLDSLIPAGWKATLCAVDGDVAAQVAGRLHRVPADATNLVVSVGGNDAISNADILGLKVGLSAEVFDILADRARTFEADYDAMLSAVLAKNLPTAVCTVYFPRFPEPEMQKVSVAALSTFNDVIIRRAAANGLPILDLRLVCNEPDDYANEIEPSGKGGRKIAAKILELIESHPFANKRTCIYF
jgi:lysophospholipase L1-like esterase